MTTNRRMKALSNVAEQLKTVGSRALDGDFENRRRGSLGVKFYPKANMGGEVTRRVSKVDWKMPQNGSIPRRHNDHRYTTLRRELPSCDECGGTLQAKYILCSCGLELHVRCIRIHKKKLKQ